jgi:hypothetical protein
MLQEIKIGMKFNDWTILDDTPIRENEKYRNRSFKVRCKCGKEHIVLISSLRTGASKMCRSCSSKECMSDKFKATWNPQVYGGLGNTLYSSIKNRAKHRGIEFELSKEFMWELLEKQQFKCALSGLDIHLSTKLNKSRTNPEYSLITASLDRINSDKDYTEDNVQWIHKDINKMKNAFDQSYFIQICSLIHQVHGKQ